MRPGLLLLFCACATPALAGPPYATDDPEPTDRGRWEVYGFATGSHTPGDTDGEAGVDLNYGAAEDVQLTLTLPVAYQRAGGQTHAGMGDVEAAVKWKGLHQAEGSWTPDVAVFPRIFLPTAKARFGSRRVSVLLPVWAQKDFGPWSVFGGGGYLLNPGGGNRNVWSEGLAVTRQVTERLNLGAEATHRSRETDDGRAYTALGVGVVYKMTDHWSLLASGGPGVQNAREEGRYSVYLALKANY
jgi:hypothetical protein